MCLHLPYPEKRQREAKRQRNAKNQTRCGTKATKPTRRLGPYGNPKKQHTPTLELPAAIRHPSSSPAQCADTELRTNSYQWGCCRPWPPIDCRLQKEERRTLHKHSPIHAFGLSATHPTSIHPSTDGYPCPMVPWWRLSVGEGWRGLGLKLACPCLTMFGPVDEQQQPESACACEMLSSGRVVGQRRHLQINTPYSGSVCKYCTYVHIQAN